MIDFVSRAWLEEAIVAAGRCWLLHGGGNYKIVWLLLVRSHPEGLLHAARGQFMHSETRDYSCFRLAFSILSAFKG